MYQIKYEALNRSIRRLEEFYSGKIDNIDSFNGPKDYVFSYFDCTYSLKESLRKVAVIDIEKFILENNIIALGIDISNKNKHCKLDRPRTKHIIGKVNTHIYIFDHVKDRTELTIEIDGIKTDTLALVKENFACWKSYLIINSLIKENSMYVA